MSDRSTILMEIAAERRRQVDVEGFTPEADEFNYGNGQIARAAAAYAFSSATETYSDHATASRFRAVAKMLWPWSEEWWKPKDPRRDLIRAGALILAEIERLDRATETPGDANG